MGVTMLQGTAGMLQLVWLWTDRVQHELAGTS